MEAEETSSREVSFKKKPRFKKILQCPDKWGWDVNQMSHEVTILGRNRQTALFHAGWSSGSAGVRGERALNAGPPSRFYWEVNVGDRIFGTSMMFGIGTKKSPLHIDSFVNMIGCDDQGWGLSHKGLLFHNDHWIEFTQHFVENKGTTIGLLFDGMEGTLSYFKDGIPLGVAFTGLNLVKDKLYPMVSSTAAKTQVTLQNMQRDFINLRDRCRQTILDSLQDKSAIGIDSLELPRCLIDLIKHDIDLADSVDGFEHASRIQPKSDNPRFLASKSLNHFPSNAVPLQFKYSIDDGSYSVLDF